MSDYALIPQKSLKCSPSFTMIWIARSFLLQLSILVHPDKNQDDADRAQKAFEGNALPFSSGCCTAVAGQLFLCSCFQGLLGVKALLRGRTAVEALYMRREQRCGVAFQHKGSLGGDNAIVSWPRGRPRPCASETLIRALEFIPRPYGRSNAMGLGVHFALCALNLHNAL